MLNSLFHAKRLGEHSFGVVTSPPLLTALKTETNRLGMQHYNQSPRHGLVLTLLPDLQHNLCILCQDNRLFTAPISADNPPKRVLDAGCGTGIWAIEFGESPSCSHSLLRPSLTWTASRPIPRLCGCRCRLEPDPARLVCLPLASPRKNCVLTISSVPPNVEFFVDDLEEEWTYQTHFDFIYMRLLTGSILNWPKLFGQAFQYDLHPLLLYTR